jgi:hypothetical protein
MAGQPPMASPGAASMPPGAGAKPGLSEPRAAGVAPAEADRDGENKKAP